MFAALRSAMRPGVPYITLVQHDANPNPNPNPNPGVPYITLVQHDEGYG